MINLFLIFKQFSSDELVFKKFDLFELGIANSLFAIQLMTFIEKTFALQVETEDLDIDNFRSVSASTAFVMRKSGPQCLGFQASGVSKHEKSVGAVD